MANLKEELEKIEIPVELSERGIRGVQMAKSEMKSSIKGRARKRLMPIVLAATLIVPTGALAYQSLLADELYGSFENVKKHVAYVTMESYLLFDAKLNQAKGDLGKAEYEQFKELMNVFTSAKLEYGNGSGNIDYTQVPSEKLEELKAAMFDIQPYFDKLNGLKSSKEVLSSEEYEAYIEALMTYEMVMAKSGITSPSEVDKIPADLQEKFQNAQDVLRYVDEKQRE